tara:strand:- start:181 stop:507 length:327 start_codon:yes stop_codon:yes gene_type:complete
MKINKLHIIALIFLLIASACKSLSEGMTGTKRSKKADEFLIHKKKPLILPPDFYDVPLPKPEKKKQAEVNNAIEDLLNIKKQGDQNEISQSQNDKSLESSILKKINKN